MTASFTVTFESDCGKSGAAFGIIDTNKKTINVNIDGILTALMLDINGYIPVPENEFLNNKEVRGNG